MVSQPYRINTIIALNHVLEPLNHHSYILQLQTPLPYSELTSPFVLSINSPIQTPSPFCYGIPPFGITHCGLSGVRLTRNFGSFINIIYSGMLSKWKNLVYSRKKRLWNGKRNFTETTFLLFDVYLQCLKRPFRYCDVHPQKCSRQPPAVTRSLPFSIGVAFPMTNIPSNGHAFWGDTINEERSSRKRNTA